MKRYIIAVLVLLLLLSGCQRRPASYQFPNKQVEILSIELMLNQNEFGQGTDESNMYLIRELNANEIVDFMNDIYELETKQGGPPPPWGYGYYIARVTYANGNVEMLGTINIEHIPNGSTPTGVGRYYFTNDGFETVFGEYVDLSEFPESPPGS